MNIVYNAIDLKKFQNPQKRVFDKDHAVIGNVARMMPEKKGQDILVAAMMRLKKEYPTILDSLEMLKTFRIFLKILIYLCFLLDMRGLEYL